MDDILALIFHRHFMLYVGSFILFWMGFYTVAKQPNQGSGTNELISIFGSKLNGLICMIGSMIVYAIISK